MKAAPATRLTLSAALEAGARLRPLLKRDGYLDPATGAASILWAAAEAVYPAADPAKPATALAMLKGQCPLLRMATRCPACNWLGSVEEVLEVHLGDQHRWERVAMVEWVKKLEAPKPLEDVKRG